MKKTDITSKRSVPGRGMCNEIGQGKCGKIFFRQDSLLNPANIITAIRLFCSLALVFCHVFSAAFYVFYIMAGITDMIDGTVARMMHTVSDFGAGLDTLADTVFAAVCLAKLLPVFDVPWYIWLCITGIAVIKVVNIISGFVMCGGLVTVHSVMNKLTGMALFFLPFSVSLIDLRITSAAVCLLAGTAAIQEESLIRKENPNRKENLIRKGNLNRKGNLTGRDI